LDYEKCRPKHERFRVELHRLIEKLCDQKNITAQLESRTKSVSSFQSKINRPGKNYIDPLHDVTDLVGVRVVVNTLVEVETVAALLRKEFSVDEENSINKAEALDPDKFGYLSQHLIVKLPEHRCVLSEWAEFSGLSAEIQVRTALQHTWSVIQHPLDYKSTSAVPKELRRRLFRLSALFELADAELDELMIQANTIKSTYASKTGDAILDLPINKESLEVFLNESKQVEYWDRIFNQVPNMKTEAPNWWGSRDVDMPKLCGLKTMRDMETLLEQSVDWWEEYVLSYFLGSNSCTKNGILLYALISNFPDILTKDVLKSSFGFGAPEKALDLAKKLNPKFSK